MRGAKRQEQHVIVGVRRYDSSSWSPNPLKPADAFCQCRLKDLNICRRIYPKAYTVTFWTGAWKKGGDNSPCDEDPDDKKT